MTLTGFFLLSGLRMADGVEAIFSAPPHPAPRLVSFPPCLIQFVESSPEDSSFSIPLQGLTRIIIDDEMSKTQVIRGIYNKKGNVILKKLHTSWRGLWWHKLF